MLQNRWSLSQVEDVQNHCLPRPQKPCGVPKRALQVPWGVPRTRVPLAHHRFPMTEATRRRREATSAMSAFVCLSFRVFSFHSAVSLNARTTILRPKSCVPNPASQFEMLVNALSLNARTASAPCEALQARAAWLLIASNKSYDRGFDHMRSKPWACGQDVHHLIWMEVGFPTGSIPVAKLAPRLQSTQTLMMLIAEILLHIVACRIAGRLCDNDIVALERSSAQSRTVENGRVSSTRVLLQEGMGYVRTDVRTYVRTYLLQRGAFDSPSRPSAAKAEDGEEWHACWQ